MNKLIHVLVVSIFVGLMGIGNGGEAASAHANFEVGRQHTASHRL